MVQSNYSFWNDVDVLFRFSFLQSHCSNAISAYAQEHNNEGTRVEMAQQGEAVLTGEHAWGK